MFMNNPIANRSDGCYDDVDIDNDSDKLEAMSNLQDYGQAKSSDSGEAIRSVTSEPTMRESYQQQNCLSPKKYC